MSSLIGMRRTIRSRSPCTSLSQAGDSVSVHLCRVRTPLLHLRPSNLLLVRRAHKPPRRRPRWTSTPHSQRSPSASSLRTVRASQRVSIPRTALGMYMISSQGRALIAVRARGWSPQRSQVKSTRIRARCWESWRSLREEGLRCRSGYRGCEGCGKGVVERGLCGVWEVDGDDLRLLDDLHGL